MSPVLFSIATDYKLWIIKHGSRQESSFSKFYVKNFQREKCSTTSYKSKYYPMFLCQYLDNKNFNLSEKKLLLSGDIDLNPGPAIMPELLNIRLHLDGD